MGESATDDNAAAVRARPRVCGMIGRTGPKAATAVGGTQLPYVSRSSILRTFPDTVIGNASSTWSLLGTL